MPVVAACFALAAPAADGAVVFVNLGTGAPTVAVGPAVVTPFDTAAQAAIANLASVTTIPGSPIPGSLTSSATLTKRTVPAGGWATWSHGYTGPVFFATGTTTTLTLPPGARVFRFGAEPNSGTVAIEAVTDSGATSGPISVVATSGATGFGFYTTAGETITTVTITVPAAAGGFAIGEFGIGQTGGSASTIPTLGTPGLALSALGMLAAGLLLLRGRAFAA